MSDRPPAPAAGPTGGVDDTAPRAPQRRAPGASSGDTRSGGADAGLGDTDADARLGSAGARSGSGDTDADAGLGDIGAGARPGSGDIGADARPGGTDAGLGDTGASSDGAGARPGSSSGGDEALALAFETHRPRLRAVAYRMLGSLTEADDAVQEAWIRLFRSDAGEVRNLAAWLTTVVGRVCLNVLESRRVRREEPFEADIHVPDPIVSPVGEADPESEALLADSVGLALMVVLDTLDPAERLAFVLHDMFAVPFDDIAPMVERNPAATRQLASRARRRVQVAQRPEADLPRQREVVDAFLAASRRGDFEALLSVLDPEVVLRADFGGGNLSRMLRGAQAVARGARAFASALYEARLIMVNGTLGAMAIAPDGGVYSVLALTVRDGRIAEMNILGDPSRLTALGFPVAS